MSPLLTSCLALAALFYLLGKSADLAIYNLRIIAEKLGICIFFLGLVMGFFTSLPEMAIGINAIIDNVQNISLGNLFGGIMVLFGLILGINICLQRKIKSEQNLWQFGAIMIFLIIPIILGLDGTLGMIEGLIIIVGYFVLLFALYYRQKHGVNAYCLSDRKGLIKHSFLFLLGVVLVLIVANFTVDLAASILSKLPLSKFVVGVIIFAIGTNFPEIIIAIRAWKNHVRELSLSNLLGSGMANMLLVGIFSVMRPFHLAIDNSYYVLLVGLAVLLTLVFIFYKTDKALKRKEGVLLILVYLLFIVLQIVFEESVTN
jgi:cation:H+ antiporter